MNSRLNPYIQFKDNARQAMEFYQTVFGGELAVNTFAEFGMGDGPDANLVMHSQLETPAGYTLMGSDTPSHMEYKEGSRITVSLSGTEGDALHGYWDKLSGTGTVMMPLEKQVWGDEFGMCTDQFGVDWMVNIGSGEQGQA